MIKVNKEERIKLANIYNTEGKSKMYELLREKYLINNPSQAFASMKKAPYLFYDAKQDRFGVKDVTHNLVPPLNQIKVSQRILNILHLLLRTLLYLWILFLGLIIILAHIQTTHPLNMCNIGSMHIHTIPYII